MKRNEQTENKIRELDRANNEGIVNMIADFNRQFKIIDEDWRKKTEDMMDLISTKREKNDEIRMQLHRENDSLIHGDV